MEKMMIRGFRIFFVCAFLLGLAPLTTADEPQGHPQGYPRRIVVFEETFVNEPAKVALLERFGGVVIKPLPVINPNFAIAKFARRAGRENLDEIFSRLSR